MNNHQNTEQYARDKKLWKRADVAGGVAFLVAEGAALSYFGIRDGLGIDVLLSTTLIASPIGLVTPFVTRGILEITPLYARLLGRYK